MNKTSRKYTFDKNVWKKLTPESCYWAGFVAADGCLRHSSKNSYNLKVSLHKKDAKHLEKLIQFCGYNGPLYNDGGNMRSLVVYANTSWHKDLEKNFNITPKKTFTLAPPKFESEYLKLCFILGFLDGDGCVYKNKKRGDVSVSCVGGSEVFIKWIHEELCKLSSKKGKRRTKPPKIKIDTRNGAFVSCISGAKAEFIIKNFSKFDVPKLKRKWGIYE